jgi:hypothetical protein
MVLKRKGGRAKDNQNLSPRPGTVRLALADPGGYLKETRCATDLPL